MTNNLIIYYIPNNPNVTNGAIYTLYINHNKNLDISSISNSYFEDSNKVHNQKTQSIIEHKTDYNILDLNNQMLKLIEEKTKIIEIEKEMTDKLKQLNNNYQKILNQLIKKGVV